MNRLRLTRPAAERLLALAGVGTPWRIPTPTRTASRLGAPIPDLGTGPAAEDPDAELARLGALTADGVHPDLATALGVLDQPRVLLDVDLAARRPGGDARFHSWQRLSGDRVVALSTTGDDLDLAWHRRSEWVDELSRVPGALPATTSPAAPRRLVTLPQQLLVASGAALRAGRGDLADALAREHHLDPVEVRSLHDCRARLRVVVTGPARVRWVGWLLLADGWRELGLLPDGVGLHLTPVTPLLLGVRVERLVNGALS